MTIISGYTNTTGYVQTKTLQPVVSQPATTPNIQPMPQSNLSQMQPEKVTAKPQPQQTTEQTEKSTKRFALRLTSRQRRQVKRLQKSWGLSTESAVIKKLIDDSKEENNSNDLALQINELTAIKTELNRIGININQIAKKANQMGMSMNDLNAVMNYMNDVCKVIYGKGLKK